MSKEIEDIIGGLVSKQSPSLGEAKKATPKPAYKPTPVAAWQKPKATATGFSKKTLSDWNTSKGYRPDRFPGCNEEFIKEVLAFEVARSKESSPARKGFTLFGDEVDWDRVRFSKAGSEATFGEWLGSLGYSDLHPSHDAAAFDVFARNYMRIKANGLK